ncbi:MAG: DNA mismatch repair protein MutS [Oligoflexales bacterium]
MKKKTITPMMQQYYDLKKQCEDHILFFRMGDFYEIFDTDAVDVAPKLGLTLTSRERGDQNKVPFCGVPHHSARGYWLKLLQLGYRVSIADQVEDAALAQGLVRREIIRTLTPGCIDDLDGLESSAPNYLMGCWEEPSQGNWAVFLVDISTGELRLGRVESLSEVVSVVQRFEPKELLVRRFCLDMVREALEAVNLDMLYGCLAEGALRDPDMDVLKAAFGTLVIEEHPCGPVAGGVPLLAALIVHLNHLKMNVGFRVVLPLYEAERLHLNEIAIRDLELFETQARRDRKSSLIGRVDYTVTPMGSRKLRYDLSHPWVQSSRIEKSHQAVAAFVDCGQETVGGLRKNLKSYATDLERLAVLLQRGRVQPQDLRKLQSGLRSACCMSDFLTTHPNFEGQDWDVRRDVLGVSAELEALLGSRLVEEPGALGTGRGVFRSGFDRVLDEKLRLTENSEAMVAEFEERLRGSTGISSLKTKRHKTYGLLLEVTKSNLKKVPEDFIRRQTMVNCERFVTSELVELDESLMNAVEQAVIREQELFISLVSDLAFHFDAIVNIARVMAEVDVLQSHAWLAVTENYTKAETTNREIYLYASRHPVAEFHVGKHQYVPNTIHLLEDAKHMVITGPNMAGKSTVMRQTALCAILNQAGGYVPAEKAALPVFDQIFTRVGASDDISRGLSTFMVEMSEAAMILRQSTHKSLVILDEVGRGTSTEDGLAIALAILEELVKEVDCWTLFATHYHELVPLVSELKNVCLAQTEVVKRQGGVRFTHRLVEGSSGSSYGIEVAKIAGVPEHVVARARENLLREKPVVHRVDEKLNDDFEIIEKLENVSLPTMTPMDAMNFLNELCQIAEINSSNR